MVVSRGKQYSVFELQHNDHVWLEVWDDSAQSCFRADPAYGVVVPGEKRGGPFSTDRTAYYLIDGFGEKLYGGGLTQLPSWQQWVASRAIAFTARGGCICPG